MSDKTLIKAIFAGIYIGIAGLIYLSIDQKIIGALLFSSGLLLVVSKDYALYTGRIGYMLPYRKNFLKMIVTTISGNIIGISIIGMLFLLSNQAFAIQNAEAIIEAKLSKGLVEAFVLAIFCGMLMYTGVHGYKTIEHPTIRVLIVIFSVMIFILAGFEHSIANMLYIVVGKAFSLKAFVYLVVWLIGNMIGSVSLNLLEHHIKTT